jgi:hypothetical protein
MKYGKMKNKSMFNCKIWKITVFLKNNFNGTRQSRKRKFSWMKAFDVSSYVHTW